MHQQLPVQLLLSFSIHRQHQSSDTMGTTGDMEHSEYSQNNHHLQQQICINKLNWSAGTAPGHSTCQQASQQNP
ncbi:hypothetical protein Nepgr_007891 [Nepenthes gracilis]|uniref:Uncharacterized protein n=1 Tax=Nepenthes gracilis TaxID=150966 RepID=A0AAD3S8N0_NEPGR|nr:hypothetical protein Nepgr_007891 [Nepenthes gracilis]